MGLRARIKAKVLRGLLKLADQTQPRDMTPEQEGRMMAYRARITQEIARLEGRAPINVVDLSGQGIDTREGAS